MGAGWDRFWFTAVDPATLGLVRCCAGAMILYTHLVWSLGLVQFFGEGGWHPNSQSHFFSAESSFAWSHLHWFDSPVAMWSIHILCLIVLAMFMVGLFTRVTSIVSFLIVVSYANRAAGMLFGLDQINCLLAAYLMIGPCGQAFSVDRWLAKRKLDQKPLMDKNGSKENSSHHLGSLPVSKSVGANISIRLIQLHMCLIYLFAGAGKLRGDSWWDGEAIWGAIANKEYQSMDLTWLVEYPELVHLMSHVTIFFELSYCALVWPKTTRPFVIALAVILHLGIAFGLGMMTFGLVMLIANMAFVSPKFVRRLLGQESELNKGSAVSLAVSSIDEN